MCESTSHAIAKMIERRALDILQAADEMGGPGVRDYIGLMRRVARECDRRADAAKKLLPEETVLQWARENIHPDAFIEHTGGGCTALQIPVPSSRPDGPADYWWITDDAGAPETLSDVPGEGLAVCLYNGANDDPAAAWVGFTVRNIMQARDLIRGLADVQWR